MPAPYHTTQTTPQYVSCRLGRQGRRRRFKTGQDVNTHLRRSASARPTPGPVVGKGAYPPDSRSPDCEKGRMTPRLMARSCVAFEIAESGLLIVHVACRTWVSDIQSFSGTGGTEFFSSRVIGICVLTGQRAGTTV